MIDGHGSGHTQPIDPVNETATGQLSKKIFLFLKLKRHNSSCKAKSQHSHHFTSPNQVRFQPLKNETHFQHVLSFVQKSNFKLILWRPKSFCFWWLCVLWRDVFSCWPLLWLLVRPCVRLCVGGCFQSKLFCF